QHDFIVVALTPGKDKAGTKYVINGEFKITAPAADASGPASTFRRTLYIGTNADPMAALPETRQNSPSLRFLRGIAKVNHLPTNNQPDERLCASILGKAFSCRIDARPYTGRDGSARTSMDFGRNVTAVGVIPAKLDREIATPAATGHPAANGST